LEEENQRRDFATACEQQSKQLAEFKAEVCSILVNNGVYVRAKVGEAVSLCKKEASDRSALESKIKVDLAQSLCKGGSVAQVLEAELDKMYNRLLESENKVKKGGCCVIS